jgi:hypothetical protein
MYGTDEGRVKRLVAVMNGVWRGKSFPVDWRECVIFPIYKKDEKDKVENYRGITLLNTVSETMKREIQEKGVVSDS